LYQIKFKANDTVVICLSGRGDKDLATYMNANEIIFKLITMKIIFASLLIVLLAACKTKPFVKHTLDFEG